MSTRQPCQGRQFTAGTYTSADVRRIAVDAAMEALTRFAATHPMPSAVSISQAAEMLNVSGRTVTRLKLPRNKTGKIPVEAVLNALRAST